MSMNQSFVRGARGLAKLLCFGLLAPAMALAQAGHDHLSSWNDGPAKKAIVEFVRTTTDKAIPNYVPPGERIATFDNDGTLWPEQPMYVQALFAFDRVKALLEIVMATHAGMTTDEFQQIVKDWKQWDGRPHPQRHRRAKVEV